MKFGFKTSQQNVDWNVIVDCWRQVDSDNRWDSAWNFDHFYPIHGDLEGTCYEAWTMLAALAQETSRITLGSMVNGAVYRHPAVLANMASTVDVISNGRFELGLGTGWNELECEAYGIQLGTWTERFDRFTEYLECVDGLLRNTTTSFNGTYYKLTEARNEPKGPQRPRPPICIGGSGEKKTMPLVARWADHWNYPVAPSGDFSTNDFEAKRERLYECCSDISRDPSTIRTSTHLIITSEMTDSEMRSIAESYASVNLDLLIIYPMAPFDSSIIERSMSVLADLVH